MKTYDYEIDGLKFKNTFIASPEQYNVYNSNEEQVAYIRVCWGYITVRVPDNKGQIVLDEFLGQDGWQGCFSNPKERKLFLTKSAKKINEWVNSQQKD